jgi:hypothetical protein
MHMLTKEAGEVAMRRLQYCVDTLRLPQVSLLYEIEPAKREQLRKGLMDQLEPPSPAQQQYDDRWNISIFNPPVDASQPVSLTAASSHTIHNTAAVQSQTESEARDCVDGGDGVKRGGVKRGRGHEHVTGPGSGTDGTEEERKEQVVAQTARKRERNDETTRATRHSLRDVQRAG